MTEYKLFTYDDPVDRLSFNSKRAIDLDNLTDDGKALLQEWFPADYAKGFLAVDYAKAILEGVSKLKVQLGIGKRVDEIVKRWREGHPWLPDIITIPRTANYAAKKFVTSDAAPITQDTLYNEAEQLSKLCKLSRATVMELVTAKPAWRQPVGTKNNIGVGEKFFDGLAYELKKVAPDKWNIFIDAMIDQFQNILQSPLSEKMDRDSCKPKNIFSCDGLCGAWYIVEVQYIEDPNGLKTQKNLKILIPVGLIKPAGEDDPTPILVPFGEDKTDVYTPGLDFCFIGFENKVASAEFFSSVHWLKKVFLDREEFSIQKNFFRSLGWGKFQIPIDNLNLRESAEWRKAKGDARIDQARKLAPEIVGKESLVVIAVDGVHVLKNEKEIGAWCAKYELLDKMIPPPRFELSQGDKILRFVPFATTDIGKWLDSPLPDDMQNTDRSYDSLSEDQKKKFSFPSVNDYTDNEYANGDPSVFRLRLLNPPIDNDEVEVTLKVLANDGTPIDKVSQGDPWRNTATHRDGVKFKLKKQAPARYDSPYLRVATTFLGQYPASKYGIIHSLPPKGSDMLKHARQFGRILRVKVAFGEGNNLEQDFHLGGQPYARIPVQFFWVGAPIGNSSIGTIRSLAHDKLAQLNQWWAGQGLEFELVDSHNPILVSAPLRHTLISIGDFNGKAIVSEVDFRLTITLQVKIGSASYSPTIDVSIGRGMTSSDVAGSIANAIRTWTPSDIVGLEGLKLDAKIYSITTPRYRLATRTPLDPVTLDKIGDHGPVDVEILKAAGTIAELEITKIAIDPIGLDIHVPPVERPFHDAGFLPPAAVTRHWVRRFSSAEQNYVAIVIESDTIKRHFEDEEYISKLCQDQDTKEVTVKIDEPLLSSYKPLEPAAISLLNYGLWNEQCAGFIMFVSERSAQVVNNDIQHEMGHVLADLNHTIEDPAWFYLAELMHSGGPNPPNVSQITRNALYVSAVKKSDGVWQGVWKCLTNGYGGAVRQRIREKKPEWLTGSKQWTT